MTSTALRRVIGRAAARRSQVAERCGLCAAEIEPEHRHVLDGGDGGVLCACPACALLLAAGTAGGDRYVLIPRERTRLTGVTIDVLDVPVGLAFFVRHTDGRVLAHYPSPLGTTQSQIDPAAWRTLEASVPRLAAMKPGVEAYLVRTSDGPGLTTAAARADVSAAAVRPDRDQHWILPIDDCFRLVAVIRQHWSGMAGGSAVWREVARFFADLESVEQARHRHRSNQEE